MNAEVNAYTYQLQPGTLLVLGLYVNGQLRTSQNYTLTGSKGPSANVVGNIKDGSFANFTNNILSFSVWLLRTPLPAGTVITVTIWASNPLWLQVDISPLTHSYDTINVASDTPPSIEATEGILAPATVTVMVVSD